MAQAIQHLLCKCEALSSKPQSPCPSPQKTSVWHQEVEAPRLAGRERAFGAGEAAHPGGDVGERGRRGRGRELVCAAALRLLFFL
jgi:hypothetical protein